VRWGIAPRRDARSRKRLPVSASLPRAVRALLSNHVSSVGAVELLLTLRARPDRVWSEHALCEVLECPPSWAELQLRAMTAAGLVEAVADGWRFAPADAGRKQAVDALDEAYRLHSREVLRFIFTNPAHEPEAFTAARRSRPGERR
jgi:hypothetical protein